MGPAERVLGSAVAWNNQRITDADPRTENPLDLAGLAWASSLAAAYPLVRAEWDRFVDMGGRLPFIEDLIAESQGNEGPWRAGLLVHAGRAVGPLADHFPDTIGVLREVPGLRSALFSLLEPGTELPEHSGPNAGVLRYHLGISCPAGAALRVERRVVRYSDGKAVLFDDTAPHSAWNRGAFDRVTLFCELDRPLTGGKAVSNRLVQRVIGLDGRYRDAPRRAARWHRALNRDR